ncbi:smd2 [Symbiodinium sp. CCMP2592]|nr:smd2 [Symbiodinium sp. CCMP2592]
MQTSSASPSLPPWPPGLLRTGRSDGWVGAVETLTSAESHSGLFRQLRELRGELRKARGRSVGNQGPGTANWDQLRQWVEAQLALPASEGGRQKLFPELDLLVSTRACVGPQMELPWFLLGGRAEDAGVELASRSGALCGPGLPVAGELVSRPGRRATVPSGGIDQEPPGLHRLEAYGLELMAPCRVQNASADGRCFCGAEPCSTWTDFGRQCCREDDGIVQWPQRAFAQAIIIIATILHHHSYRHPDKNDNEVAPLFNFKLYC